jgi:CRISPR/Cas system-associated exonuclease Cas4 (RecB family)
MTYSYTQISQYLTCPRRYRHRYLDGWKEKDTRAAMLFGRAFEQALGAYFRREDPGAVLFAEPDNTLHCVPRQCTSPRKRN